MKYFKTRLFSFIILGGMATGCFVLGREGYFATTDAFIAPAILSPDSDVVLEQKIKLEQILLEKGRAAQSLTECDSDIEAGNKAIVRLNELKEFASNALAWTKTTTNQQVSMGAQDIQTLSAQKDQINEMLTRQALLVYDAQKNLAAGLIQKPDVDREQQVLDGIKVQLFENERSRMAAELIFNQASMGQQALISHKSSMQTPEQIINLNQLITVECELFRTNAEVRTKMAEKESMQLELDKIAQLENELRARPLFQAIDKRLDVAFASYSSLKGITPGARLMNCFWGVFNCQEVGTVDYLINGESVMPDPFGSGQIRGQFVLLKLNKIDHDEAMQSKILRVRDGNNSMYVNSKVAGK